MNDAAMSLTAFAIAAVTFWIFLLARSAWETAARPRRENASETPVAPEPARQPDPFAAALDRLAEFLRGGQSLEQALARLGAEGEPPLADEFTRCAAQIKLGLPMRTALEGLAKRLPNHDVSALASAVHVVRTTGGNLPALLERLAQSVRERQPPPAPVVLAPPPAPSPSSPVPSLGRSLLIPLTLVVPVAVAAFAVWQPHVVNGLLTRSAGPWLAGLGVTIEALGLLGVDRFLQAKN